MRTPSPPPSGSIQPAAVLPVDPSLTLLTLMALRRKSSHASHRAPLPDPLTLVRPSVRSLHPYVPGEQPKIPGLIKLNTNENPYPPAPRVLAAIRDAVDARLRLYPSPTAEPLRAKLARLHGCTVDHIIVGNGSDELLALATRTFVEPLAESSDPDHSRDSRSRIQFLHPSYSLYPVLANIHNAQAHPVPLNRDFSLPSLSELERHRGWDSHAALTFITTPNAPSGCGYATADLDNLCRRHKGVMLLDEAYVDFARENAMSLALYYPHVLVARTFSKAYSLCFQRVGYCVGHPALIDALHRIRDSYNVNGLGQIAATETLRHLPYYRRCFAQIVRNRDRLRRELLGLGFEIPQSQTNFLLARPPGRPAETWFHELRRRRILVRWFRQPEISAFLRITIGNTEGVDALLHAVRQLLDPKQG